jgi:hypothetical protein
MPAKEGIVMPDGKENEAARCLPVTGSEDVEYSEELADADDREAQLRAEAADRRAEKC